MSSERVFKALFEPRSIAFIGASTNVYKWGFNILHHLIRGGYAGELYPVNPQGGDWYGRTVYPGMDAIPNPIDLAVIVVPEALVPEAVRQCVAKGIPAGIVITAGFAETGEAGAQLEREVVRIAREGGMRLVGPNTMGVFSAFPTPMQCLMTSMPIPPGPVSIITQSGNLGTSLAYRFLRRSIGLGRIISSGNEGDLTAEDYLELLRSDKHTCVISMYIEGLRDPKRFFALSRQISPEKPIILLKGGRTALGAQAAASHTGAMASDDRIFSALCRQAGIIQVEDMDGMIDVAGMLLSQPRPRGGRVGILTQGGGWGVIATDACIAQGLSVPALEDNLISELDKVLPVFWSRGNPIDLVAPGRVTVITDAVKLLMQNRTVDAVLLMGLGYMTLRARRLLGSEVVPASEIEPSARTLIKEEDKLFKLLADLIARKDVPVIPVMDLMAFDAAENNLVKLLDSQGIMAYSSPERAIAALAKVLDYQRRLNS